MIFLGPAIVLLVFLAVLLLLFIIATRSLRNSWYVALGCLAMLGLSATYLTALHSVTTDRLQRLLKGLSMPAGQPVVINPTTNLIEVEAQKRALIYMYDTTDRKILPTRSDAIRQNCRATDLRAALELGAQVEHRYRAGTTIVQHIIVRREDCF